MPSTGTERVDAGLPCLPAPGPHTTRSFPSVLLSQTLISCGFCPSPTKTSGRHQPSFHLRGKSKSDFFAAKSGGASALFTRKVSDCQVRSVLLGRAFFFFVLDLQPLTPAIGFRFLLRVAFPVDACRHSSFSLALQLTLSHLSTHPSFFSNPLEILAHGAMPSRRRATSCSQPRRDAPSLSLQQFTAAP